MAAPARLKKKFEKLVAERAPRNSFENCLKYSASQFIVRRGKDTDIVAGYPWFGRWGRDTFIALPGVTLLACAPFYETEPVDVPEAFADCRYLNTVAIYAVALPLDAWSDRCHAAEDALGRVRTGYHHPRTIDIDLLYYGDAVRDEPHLHLPHPQIASRAFVCRPLADVRPQLRLPGFSATVAELLAALPPGGVRRWEG